MFFFFFFQAEDGIRDLYVTGVQTCALPIWIDSAVIGGRVRVGVGLERPAVLREGILSDRIRKEKKAVDSEGDAGGASLISLVRGVFLRARAEQHQERQRHEEPKERFADHGHLSRSAPSRPPKSG